MWDTLLLMALALVVFGPRRLPKIGRQLGKLMYEFRKASNDFKLQMEEELRNAEEADRRKKVEEDRQRTLAAVPAPPQLEQSASDAPATAETQESGATTSIEDPYPAATTAPPIEAEATGSQEAATPAEHSPDLAPDVAPAAPILNIQPPSTGERIAAERPGKATETVEPEAERSEPAAHHG